MNREIENRIQKANNVSYQLAPLLKHSDIPIETKSKIFLPTLTYQCQTWTMTKPLERKIITCEMRYFRKAVNKTRRDMIPNTKIRIMVVTKSIHHHIQQQRIKWFGHLRRLPIQHPAQRAYNTRFSGRKARGRPRKTLSQYKIPPAQAFRREVSVSVSVSAHDGIVALGKAHTRSAPSLSSLLKVALETVPIFAWLNTDRSRPWRVECQPLPFSTPLSFRRSML